MNKTVERILSVIIYGGLDREKYKSIGTDITDNNRKFVIGFSAIAFFTCAILSIASYMKPGVLYGSTTFLFPTFSLFFIIMLQTIFYEKKFVTRFCVYSFMTIMLLMGIYAGCIDSPEEFSTLYLVMIFAVQSTFVTKPIHSSLVLFLAQIVYVTTMMFFGDRGSYTYEVNMVNSFIFSILGILSGVFMMNVKIRSIYNNYLNKLLVTIDPNTGLLNRRCLNDELDSLRKSNKEYSILMFDINGLKTINDKFGHKKGDEAIMICADAIKETYSEFGKCYRFGGDEFVVISENMDIPYAELEKKLSRSLDNDRLEIDRKLSLSSGIAKSKEHKNKTSDEIFQMADEFMYNAKMNYYKNLKNNTDK